MSRFVLTAQLQLQAPNNVAQVVRQIQNQLNNVQVNVQVQGAQQAQRQIQQITRSTNGATSAAERMGRAFAVSVRRFAAFSIATRAVGLFTSTLSDAVQTAIDFERQLVKISQVTGKSVGNLRDLTNEITNLSTSLGVSSNDLLEVTTVLAQAGLSADDTKTALNSLAKAALAPNFDSISETAEGAIAILAQFGQGVEALEGQLGSINAVAGAFAVEASDLIDVIRRTGGVFKSSGGSLNELLALFTSVRATTRESAESIGTGLRTIFTRIQRPKTIEYLKQFGVELVDLEGKFVGPFEAVRRLSEALSGLGEGDITFIRIAEELGGFRQIGKVLPLLQQFATAQAALNVANKAGNSLTQDAATAQQALAVRITKVKEEFLALVRSITETSTFQIMANTALQLASALIKVADAIKPLLPLLAAVTAVRLVRGLSSFAGGLTGGLASARTFNKGGKVLKFARGGMVPGSGNRDTVPAMLQPGEFVIRKSSVNKLGAGNLAAMNENRFALGGQARKFGIASLLPMDRPLDEVKANIPISNIRKFLSRKSGSKSIIKKGNIENVDNTIRGILGLKGKESVKTSAIAETISKQDVASKIEERVELSIQKLIDNAASGLGKSLSIQVARKADNATVKSVGSASTVGSVFEGALSMLGAPMDTSKSEQDPIDFPNGLGANFASAFQSLVGIPVDAKRTATKKILKDTANRKAAAYLANAVYSDPRWAILSQQKPKETVEISPPKIRSRSKIPQIDPNKLTNFNSGQTYKFTDITSAGIEPSQAAQAFEKLGGGMWRKKHFGGLIQKFAKGGMAAQPLVDDILSNASNTILPKPQSAIQKLIKSGGGFVDIDRTLKRTIGDQAYARARTEKERQAVLSKYFTNNTARLNDIKTAGLTQFGTELQNSIKSGQLKGSSIRVISKSPNTPGVADYLSNIFGIPSRNFAFTGGRSKVPLMRKFASGGGVGTDTVPALLTPGEFVVNRQSAQRIGYGSLNRMNKVGKYAKGGVVQQFNNGTSGTGVQPPRYGGSGPVMSGSGGNYIPFDTLSRQARNLANEQQKLTQATQTLNTATQQASQSAQSTAQATQQVSQAQTQQRKSITETVAANKFFALSMTTSLIQGFLPAVDENSGALLKLASGTLSLLTTITSVGFALEAFGVQLSLQELTSLPKLANRLGLVFDSVASVGQSLYSNMLGLVSSTASATAASTTSATADTAEAAASTAAATADSAEAAASTAATASELSQALGGLTIGVTAAFLAVQAFSSAVRKSYEDEIARTTKSGDVEAARAAGEAAAGLNTAESLQNVLGLIGGITGGILGGAVGLYGGPVTGAAGAAVGGAAGTAAGASAGRLLANLFGISEEEIKAGGSVSAASAQFVKSSKLLEDATDKSAQALQKVTSGSLSAADALLSLGPQTQAAVDAIKAAQQANADVNASIGSGSISRNIFSLGGYNPFVDSNAEIKAQAQAQNQQRTDEAKRIANTQLQAVQPILNERMRGIALGEGDFDDFLDGLDEGTFELLNLTDSVDDAYRSFQNIQKEVFKAQKAFEALSLNLRTPESIASAASVSISNFTASLEAGSEPLLQSLSVLEASFSEAGQSLDPATTGAAINDIGNALLEFGATDSVQKFKENAIAFATVSAQYNDIFEGVKDSFSKQDLRGLNEAGFIEKFGENLDKELENAGIGDEVRGRFKDIIGGIDLSDEDITRLRAGDFSVFQKYIQEAGEKSLESVQKFVQDLSKVNAELINLTKQRIDAERNLAQAQKEAFDLYLEGRQVQAEAGGRSVTEAERRNVIVGRSNAQARIAGLSDIRTGSVEELRRRNVEILGRTAQFEQRARTEDGLIRVGGVEAQGNQENVQQAYKEQADTIRSLIKLEQEELKILQEKNRLEKESLESLIKGDIDKFFEQQAAVGATAAVATGDRTIMGEFGATALSGAFENLQKQQAAGVQSLFGIQLGGAGGLVERAAGAALGARGVNDISATRTLSGTSPEEEARRANIRELGGVLAELGQIGIDMAQMRLNSAEIVISTANIKLQDILDRGRRVGAEGFSRGGTVYASNGIFVPRGTDTVPAMLTPGEFVVNRSAVNRGNNLQVLKAINNGSNAPAMSAGGKVSYYNKGGKVQYLQEGGVAAQQVGIDSQTVNKLVDSLNNFNTNLTKNIRDLQNTKFQIKLDTTNVNVNLNGGTFLANLTGQLKKEILAEVGEKIKNYKVGEGGRLQENRGVI